MRFLPLRLTARAWDCGSAAPLLNRTGGRLWAVDDPPRGARFCFTLLTNGETRDSVVSGDRTEPADGLQVNNPVVEFMNAERTTQRE